MSEILQLNNEGFKETPSVLIDGSIEKLKDVSLLSSHLESRGFTPVTYNNMFNLEGEVRGGMYKIGKSIVEVSLDTGKNAHVFVWIPNVETDIDAIQKYKRFVSTEDAWLRGQITNGIYKVGAAYEEWMDMPNEGASEKSVTSQALSDSMSTIGSKIIKLFRSNKSQEKQDKKAA